MEKKLFTIPHVVISNAQDYPNEIAMREKKFGIWKTKTWSETSEEIKAVTLSLESKGVKPKTTVGIIGNNTCSFFKSCKYKKVHVHFFAGKAILIFLFVL